MPRRDRAADLERLHLEIQIQPDDFTCGPTCLHAIYRYWGDEVPLLQLADEISRTPSGGTADVFLANHALRRGYRATIFTYNLRIFDPTWFLPGVDIGDRLRRQRDEKAVQRPVFGLLTDAYLEFLELGGTLRYVDMSATLLRRWLRRGVPILTGLSSTYLYRKVREYGPDDDDDDVRGEPQGHFVVLCGYRRTRRSVIVADPFLEHPKAPDTHYEVSLDRVVGAILLGVLTHDANLLMIEPASGPAAEPAVGR
jgi:Peptidase_C39 like family